MRGFVAISRDLWMNADFRDSEMSQREAWIWMIAHATWKPLEVRVGSNVIQLERGELAYSTRYLAGVFRWSEARVRRYFDMLKNRRMAQTKTDAGVTVVTICKYDEYQSAPADGDAGATQAATQERRTSDANKNKDNKNNKKEDMSDRQTDLDIGDPWEGDKEFSQLWALWPIKGRKRSSKKRAWPAFNRARKKHGFGQVITGARVYVSDPDTERSGGQGLHTWLNDERYREWSEQAGPRPVGQETFNGLGIDSRPIQALPPGGM